jgi:hypothetical protein
MGLMKHGIETPTYEELIRLMEVFSGDKDLMNWFVSLQSMGEIVRYSHLRSMVEGMRLNRERPDLIDAVEALMSPEIFKATIKTMQGLNR